MKNGLNKRWTLDQLFYVHPFFCQFKPKSPNFNKTLSSPPALKYFSILFDEKMQQKCLRSENNCPHYDDLYKVWAVSIEIKLCL